MEKQSVLRAHALLASLDGNGARLGRPEIVVVVDHTTANAEPVVDCGLTVELPKRVRYSRLKLHHVIWWEHGGTSDLANFLPIYERHHQKIHHHGWLVSLGPNRQLTIRLPDGQIMTTGPPKRDAA